MAKKNQPKKRATAPGSAGGSTGLSDEVVARFMALFPSFTKAYGVFDIKGLDDKGKMIGKAATLRGTPTMADFRAHLEGRRGLGIIMLLDDDTAGFGAIDYDVRTMNHAKAEEAIKAKQFPLVLCRSKSGGGHFYLFVDGTVPAFLLRERLDEYKSALGMSDKTETFPKQSSRFNDNDIGGWINLPYFNAANTERYAFEKGKPVDLLRFLELAESTKASPAQLEKPMLPEAEEAEESLFYEGPPCLQVLASQGGFVEGTRNDGMLAVSVYLRKRFPDNWESKLDEYNAKLAGLPSRELVQIGKSAGKKDYSYRCKERPLKDFCQRRKCLQRQYGVGDGAPDSKGYQINNVMRYVSPNPGDEPLWRLEVNGKPVMVSNSQLYSRDEFNRACMAQANCIPVRMNPARWLGYLNELISRSTEHPLPAEASPTGQLWEHIENFCLQKVNAMSLEEVFLGKPFRDHNAGVVMFRSQDLFRYLEDRRARYKSEQAVYVLLKERGGESSFKKVKGKGVNLWSLPMPVAPYDDESVTDIDLEGTNEL